MTEVFSGWFLKFRKEDKEFEEDLIEFLEEGKFESNAEGLKEFLKTVLYDDANTQKSKVNFIKDALIENPELVAKGMQTVGELFTKIVNKKFIKTK